MRGRPLALRGPIGELARVLGGLESLAERLAVSPRTVRRWAAGERALRGPARLAIEALLKRHKIEGILP